jgi:hypothetical protein
VEALAERARAARKLFLVLFALGFLKLDLGAVFEFTTDGGVTAGDNLFAGFHAAFDFDGGVVRDAGLDFAEFDGVAFFHEDHAVEFYFVAPGFFPLVGDVEVVVFAGCNERREEKE